MAQMYLINRLKNRTLSITQIKRQSARLFSSVTSSDDEDLDQNIPYIFLNKNESLVPIRTGTDPEELMIWNKLMSPDYEGEFKLRQTFSHQYFKLLKAVSENDL